MKNILLLICFFSCFKLQAQDQWDVIKDIDTIYREEVDTSLEISTINLSYIGKPEKITFTWGDSTIVIRKEDFKEEIVENNDYPQSLHRFSIQLDVKDSTSSILQIMWNHRVAFAAVNLNLAYQNISIITRFDVYLEEFVVTEAVDESGVPVLEPIPVYIPNSMTLIYFNN